MVARGVFGTGFVWSASGLNPATDYLDTWQLYVDAFTGTVTLTFVSGSWDRHPAGLLFDIFIRNWELLEPPPSVLDIRLNGLSIGGVTPIGRWDGFGEELELEIAEYGYWVYDPFCAFDLTGATGELTSIDFIPVSGMILESETPNYFSLNAIFDYEPPPPPPPPPYERFWTKHSGVEETEI